MLNIEVVYESATSWIDKLQAKNIISIILPKKMNYKLKLIVLLILIAVILVVKILNVKSVVNVKKFHIVVKNVKKRLEKT